MGRVSLFLEPRYNRLSSEVSEEVGHAVMVSRKEKRIKKKITKTAGSTDTTDSDLCRTMQIMEVYSNVGI